MKRFTLILGIGSLLSLTGCISSDKYSQPELPELPAWATPSLAEPAPYWNTILSDPQLDRLIAEALENNTDLRIAAARVELARAQFRIQRSDQLPGVNAAGTFERQSNFAGITETWGALLSVPSWEIDLWGRVRALSESAQQRFLASEFNRRSVEVSLTAQVATLYLNLVSLDRQVAIARSTLDSRRDSQKIIEERREAGIASGLDRRQAVILTESAVQTLAELERLQARQENALAILLGRGPGSVERGDALFKTELPPLLPAAMPSALLTQRPDIQSAEAQLSAAQLDVYAARKTFLPTVSITGYAGFISGEFSDLLEDDTEAWNIAPAAALPLFNAGRLKANLQANEAARSIAAETYVFSIRNAFREVENALIDHQSFTKQVASSSQSVQASRERLELTGKRYREGVSTYFEVLDASRELFSNELNYVRSYEASIASVIDLYRALAADWMAAPEAPEPDEHTEPQSCPDCPVCNPQK